MGKVAMWLLVWGAVSMCVAALHWFWRSLRSRPTRADTARSGDAGRGWFVAPFRMDDVGLRAVIRAERAGDAGRPEHEETHSSATM